MMKLRKSERARLEQVLTDTEDEDRELDDVVNDVFSTTTEIMLGREWYAIVAKDGDAVYHWGPYESEHKAKTALKLLTSPGPAPMQVYIYKMYRAQEVT
jgi:hypothetical protein